MKKNKLSISFYSDQETDARQIFNEVQWSQLMDQFSSINSYSHTPDPNYSEFGKLCVLLINEKGEIDSQAWEAFKFHIDNGMLMWSFILDLSKNQSEDTKIIFDTIKADYTGVKVFKSLEDLTTWATGAVDMWCDYLEMSDSSTRVHLDSIDDLLVDWKWDELNLRKIHTNKHLRRGQKTKLNGYGYMLQNKNSINSYYSNELEAEPVGNYMDKASATDIFVKPEWRWLKSGYDIVILQPSLESKELLDQVKILWGNTDAVVTTDGYVVIPGKCFINLEQKMKLMGVLFEGMMLWSIVVRTNSFMDPTSMTAEKNLSYRSHKGKEPHV